MKREKETIRKSDYNPNRDCYLSLDGKFYCYQFRDPGTGHMSVQKLEVDRDLSSEWMAILDEMDREMDLNDRYHNKIRDSFFDEMNEHMNESEELSDRSEGFDPLEEIPDCSMIPEKLLFAEEDPEDPLISKVRQIIEEECTEAQQDLFFSCYGEGMTFAEFSRKEAEVTGRQPTKQAVDNRKRKIFRKIANALEAEGLSPKSDEKDD
ncbi:MAG: hypothetical protein LUC17_01195 [Oscillospiraceae bacterium]|nr:hypothetical protein [Oscillospiraceae bacterium]